MRMIDFIPEGASDCQVAAWLHMDSIRDGLTNRKRPAIIICPGGGYGSLSDREAEPVAKVYFAAGYHTFILRYSVMGQAKDLKPLIQLAFAMAHIRKNADDWDVDADRIAVCGFSAGGHLAASLGTLFNEPVFLERFGRDVHVRPDAMILGYPVIASDEFAHVNSLSRVSGAKPGEEAYRWFGLDAHVDEQTPPAFLWHTAQDEKVPVENSLKMATAFSAAKVPFELHIFPEGLHGMSVCNETVGSKCEYNGRWIDWSLHWLNRIFGFEN